MSSSCALRGRRQLRRIDRMNCHKTTSGASCTLRIARFVRAVWCVKEPTARANFFPRVTGTGWCARRDARDVPRRRKTTARPGGKDSTSGRSKHLPATRRSSRRRGGCASRHCTTRPIVQLAPRCVGFFSFFFAALSQLLRIFGQSEAR